MNKKILLLTLAMVGVGANCSAFRKKSISERISGVIRKQLNNAEKKSRLRKEHASTNLSLESLQHEAEDLFNKKKAFTEIHELVINLYTDLASQIVEKAKLNVPKPQYKILKKTRLTWWVKKQTSKVRRELEKHIMHS